MHHRFEAIALVAVLVPLSVTAAEIVIDDFIIDFELDRFNSKDSIAGVGDLNAAFLATLGNGRVVVDESGHLGHDATGRITTNIVPSVIVSELSELPPVENGGIAFNFLHWGSFSNDDLTDGGTNDTLFIDFAFSSGKPPRVARLNAFTPGVWGVHQLGVLPISDEPFTIAIPFNEFPARTGGDVLADFRFLTSFEIDFFSGGLFDSEEDTGWRFGIDAVRVGPAVYTASDFNQDGLSDVVDLDLLIAQRPAKASNVTNATSHFDLNGDESIDTADIDTWLYLAALENGLPSLLKGDANLDGTVDALDLNVVGRNWISDVAAWSQGDFSGDGVTDAQDLGVLGTNWQGSGVAAATSVVPEPSGFAYWLAVLCVVARGGKQRSNAGRLRLRSSRRS